MAKNLKELSNQEEYNFRINHLRRLEKCGTNAESTNLYFLSILASLILDHFAHKIENKSDNDRRMGTQTEEFKISMTNKKTICIRHDQCQKKIQLDKYGLDRETLSMFQECLNKGKETVIWMKRIYSQDLVDLQGMDRRINLQGINVEASYRYWYMIMKPGPTNLNNRNIIKGSFSAVSSDMFTEALGMSMSKDHWSQFIIYPDNIRMFLIVPSLSSDYFGTLDRKQSI